MAGQEDIIERAKDGVLRSLGEGGLYFKFGWRFPHMKIRQSTALSLIYLDIIISVEIKD
jgi:hypothetical protein